MIEWNEDLSVGIKLIDDQHKVLIDLMRDLENSVNDFYAKENIGKIIDRLLGYAADHFELEEKYFDKFSYPDKDPHIAQHRRLAAAIVDFKGRFDVEGIGLAREIAAFLEGWITLHIPNFDKKYVQCFKEHGLA